MLAQRAASEGPRWTRAVEDQSAPTPGDITSELGGSIYFVRRAQLRIDQATLENGIVEGIARAEKGIGCGQTVLLARRTRTIGMCSFDARSEGQHGHSLAREDFTLFQRECPHHLSIALL